MSAKGKTSKSRAVSGEVLPPTPPKLRLHTLDDVRREMARVYADMRQGRLAPEDGTKLAFVLGQLRVIFESIRDTEFLGRLEALESRLLTKGAPNAISLERKTRQG